MANKKSKSKETGLIEMSHEYGTAYISIDDISSIIDRPAYVLDNDRGTVFSVLTLKSKESLWLLITAKEAYRLLFS